MKKRSVASTSTAAAILAGGILFSGPAAAAVVFSEDFEGGTNQFGMPTYGYSSNWTAPNTLTPSGGVSYGHGGAGTPDQVSTNSFGPLSASIINLSLDAGQIDAGLGTYNFYAQFSTYLDQNDYAEIAVTFKDAGNADLGSPVVLGGFDFVAALPSNGGRGWGGQTLTGSIPVGARSVSILLSETKSAGGTNIDGYVDNIILGVDAIPEPTTAVLIMLGAAGWIGRRRRQDG